LRGREGGEALREYKMNLARETERGLLKIPKRFRVI